MGMQEKDNETWREITASLDDMPVADDPLVIQTDGVLETVSDVMVAILDNNRMHGLRGDKLQRAIGFVGDLMLLPDARPVIAELPLYEFGNDLLVELKFPSSGDLHE